MRRFIVMSCVLGILGASTRAVGDPDNLDKKTLSAKEVATYFTPYTPAVRSCFLTNVKSVTATGHLRLELVIHHNGSVFRFGFAAPGVTKPELRRLDGCLRKLSSTWRFPLRGGFTSAVLPFYYQKSNLPGAGPYESCWYPKGCPLIRPAPVRP